MAGEWPVRTIAECASSEPYSTQIGPFGKALMADEYVVSGVPVLRGMNVNRGRFHDDDFVFIDANTADRLSKFESFPGDVLMVHKGTLGEIGLMPSKRKYRRYIMGNSMMRVRCDSTKLLPEYLYYWLTSADGQHYLFSRVSQVGVPQIQTPLTTLRQAALPVPPIPEQRAIAHILGTLDDKIELNRRMNEALEAMARSLFKSWFVDFDPVRAKSENRDPGLPKPIADLFPNRFEESELCEIPAGWSIGDIGNLVRLSRDSIDPSQFPDETFDHFSIPAFDEGRKPKPELGGSIKSNKLIVPPDAVLLSKLNPRIRRIWLPVVRDGHRGICSTEFLVTLPAPGTSREFIFSFLSSEAFSGVFETLVTGTSGSHQRVKPEGLLAMGAVIPVEPVVHQFAKVVRALLARADCGRAESQTLSALRDALLPKLISGEIRVERAERMVGRVL